MLKQVQQATTQQQSKMSKHSRKSPGDSSNNNNRDLPPPPIEQISQFLPAVTNFEIQKQEISRQSIGAFKAIRLTKHNLQLGSANKEKISNSSVVGTRNSDLTNSHQYATGVNNRHSSIDPSPTGRVKEQGRLQAVVRIPDGSVVSGYPSHESHDFSQQQNNQITGGTQKPYINHQPDEIDGFTLQKAQKRSSQSRPQKFIMANATVPIDQFPGNSFDTSNLPQTATGIPEHQQDSFKQKNGIISNKRRQQLNIDKDGFIDQKIGSADLSVDQDSSHYNQSQLQMQSMFSPQVQVHAAHMTGSVSPSGAMFPVLNEQVSEFSHLKASWQPKALHGFLTTKNSLFSKQSNSVVTHEEQLHQNLKTKQSIVHVNQLLKPAVNFGVNQNIKPQIRFKHSLQKVMPLALRRTSSAMTSKFARRFKSNKAVNPVNQNKQAPLTDRNWRNSTVPVDYEENQNNLVKKYAHNDSIYTIGEAINSSAVNITRFRQDQSNDRSQNSNNSIEKNPQQPSYQDPTLANLEKNKEIKRVKISRALEAMRKAQLQQGRMNKQNINRVCEDIMSSENCKQDKDLEQFGRHFLRKLYSIDEDSVSGSKLLPQQLMSQTLNSFSIGGRSASFKPGLSTYRGRIGAKGFSVQPSPTDRSFGGVGPSLAGQKVPFKKNQAQQQQQIITNNNDLVGIAQQDDSVQNQAEDYLLEEDSLMQELYEIQQQQESQPKNLVPLDGDIGSSFIAYMTTEANLSKTPTVQVEQRLKDGIKGTQKALHTIQSPRHIVQRKVHKIEKAALQIALQGNPKTLYPEMTVNGVVEPSYVRQTLPKADQLTNSSPPETAQEIEEESQIGDHTHGALVMLVPTAVAAYQTAKPTSFNRDHCLRNSQQATVYDEASVGSQGQVRESRLNTGGQLHDSQYDQPLAETEHGSKKNLATQQEPVRKYKKRAEQLRAAKGQFEQMFEKKQIMQAMEQTIELFESFGAEDQPPHYKYAFEDQKETPPSTKKRLRTQHYENPDAVVRDSFERKVVPLQPKATFKLAASGLTSQEGADYGSSGSPSKLIEPGARSSLLNQQPELLATGSIAQPVIRTSRQKPDLARHIEPASPAPIDVTMTNYAIDQSLIMDDSGSRSSPQNQQSPSPDTKNQAQRGKGTQALIQLAQMDPNSFLHTQPIHFDNYYVQARPLAKTIYGNQYKQAQEKLQQSRKKEKILSNQKAAKQNALKPYDRINVDSMQLDLLHVHPNGGSPKLGDELERKMSRKTSDIAQQEIGCESSKSQLKAAKEEGSPETGRVSTSLVHRQVIMEPDASQITLNQKDFHLTLETARVGTSGTLNDNVANDFCRQSQMTDKDTVDRLPLVSPGSPPIIQQPSQIITEVQTLRNKRAASKGRKMPQSPRKKQHALDHMTVVQNVQMEELFINGLSQQQLVVNEDLQPPNNPLQTERFIAKFKGKQPILRRGPNFLNRKKTTKTNTEGTIGESSPQGLSQNLSPSPAGEKGQKHRQSPGQQRAFEMVALGSKKQTINLYDDGKRSKEQNRLEGTPTPVSGISPPPGYDLHMIKEKTLMLATSNRRNGKDMVSQDISAALFVAQNYENVSNNRTSHVQISSQHGNKHESQGFSKHRTPDPHSLPPANSNETNRQDQPRDHNKQKPIAPSPLSVESGPKAPMMLQKVRGESEGHQTRITHHHRVTNDLLSPKQSGHQMMQDGATRQRPGFISAEFAKGVAVDEEQTGVSKNQYMKQQSSGDEPETQHVMQGVGAQQNEAQDLARLNAPSMATSINKQSSTHVEEYATSDPNDAAVSFEGQ